MHMYNGGTQDPGFQIYCWVWYDIHEYRQAMLPIGFNSGHPMHKWSTEQLRAFFERPKETCLGGRPSKNDREDWKSPFSNLRPPLTMGMMERKCQWLSWNYSVSLFSRIDTALCQTVCTLSQRICHCASTLWNAIFITDYIISCTSDSDHYMRLVPLGLSLTSVDS